MKGGRRTGSGRQKAAVGRAGKQSVPLPLPASLSDAERAFWLQWEPLARNMYTLTPETVPGFTLLCQVAAEVDTLRAVLTAARWEVAPGVVHPLAASYRNHVLRLEQLHARYGLAAAGRPVVKPKDDAPDDLSKWRGILSRPGDDDAPDFYTN